MQLCCPASGFKATIEVFAADKAARHVAALMGRVPPPLADLALRYVSLFAPAKHAMTFGKGRAVLEPLVVMIEQGRIVRARREWPISLSQFEAGLQHMVESRARLALPLKTHGYLLEVLAGAADKIEAKAEADEIAADRKGENRKQSLSEAEQWDAGRAQGAARLKAVQELHTEIASFKRLKLAVTKDGLLKQLLARGHRQADVEFAFSKLLEPIA